MRAKHRSHAADIVHSMLRRAEDRLAYEYREESSKVRRTIQKNLEKAHKSEVKALLDAHVSLQKQAKILKQKGLALSSALYLDPQPFRVTEEATNEALKTLRERYDAKRRKLQELEIEIALLGVANNTELQAQTRGLLEKIEEILK